MADSASPRLLLVLVALGCTRKDPPTAPPPAPRTVDVSAAMTAITTVKKECERVRGAASSARHELARDVGDQASAWKPKAEIPAEQRFATLITYAQGDRVRVVDFHDSDRAGSWHQENRHCFRADGSLAYARSRLVTSSCQRTDQTACVLEADSQLFFAASGEQIKRKRSLRDQQKDRFVHPNDVTFEDREPRLFVSTEDLENEVGPWNLGTER